MSSDELKVLLVHHGAELVSDDEHGSMLRLGARLMFVRRAYVVDPADLRDTLRLAEIGPGRFDALLAWLRSPHESAV